MAGFKNIGIKEYLSRYGYIYGIKRALFLLNPLHIVTDYENKKILYYKKVNRYLKKYEKYALVDPIGLKFGVYCLQNPVWVYWKQGIESAPDLVKYCYKSLLKYSVDEVIFLSEDNIKNYISLPQKIIELNRKGVISNAAMSDLIRFSLLEHYGGTWMDATVLLTGKLPDYITNSDFFVFRDSCGLIKNPANYTNWLIHCRKKNEVMRKIRNMSFAYWQNEKHVVDYLFTYIFLSIAIENSQGELGYFPYANSDYCRLLFDVLEDSYDEYTWNHIKEMSNVHKLTYKLTEETFAKKDSFYNQIINE